MVIKTIQWNIGGGKMRKKDDDPSDPLAYRHDSLREIINVLDKYNPDIITIQESHSDNNSNQAEIISSELGLKYFVSDVYAKSHLEEGQDLGQCIISRFPIEKHLFTLFKNPKLETKGPKGEHWKSHDKGVTSCFAQLDESLSLNVKTSHSIPLRRFCIDSLSPLILPLRKDMARKLKPESELYIYQGDLNYDEFSVAKYLPGLFVEDIKEIILDFPTTPKGRKYDHILYRNLKHKKSLVIKDVLTDHYPVFSEFQIDLFEDDK